MDANLYLPVLLNGHRFGRISPQRHTLLLSLSLPSVRSTGAGLTIELDDVSSGLAELHSALAQHGLLKGWRDEAVDVLDWSGVLYMGQMERAAARFWGSHTRAVHLNAWVGWDDGAGFQLWLAQRAHNKATDPGLWDNLVAGCLGPREGALQGLKREAIEEAGLDLASAQKLVCGPSLKIDRAVPEGWQLETLQVVDAQLPMEFRPHNQDGEVQAFELLGWAEARRRALSGTMTADAALVTLDFLRRQH